MSVFSGGGGGPTITPGPESHRMHRPARPPSTNGARRW
jgi:hypothetical protein